MRLFATKLTDKTSDPRNAKEQYKSFLRNKTRLVKRSKIITQKQKLIESPNIIDIK